MHASSTEMSCSVSSDEMTSGGARITVVFEIERSTPASRAANFSSCIFSAGSG